MTAADLLAELGRRGIVCTSPDGRVLRVAPRALVTPEIDAAIREHRAALLAAAASPAALAQADAPDFASLGLEVSILAADGAEVVLVPAPTGLPRTEVTASSLQRIQRALGIFPDAKVRLRPRFPTHAEALIQRASAAKLAPCTERAVVAENDAGEQSEPERVRVGA